ncbi:MAG: DUF1592 domain-containing protein [Nannocystaceae bacterium]|nr:DUF1592 domain-containing protein [Nannocystaceae bacterium]
MNALQRISVLSIMSTLAVGCYEGVPGGGDGADTDSGEVPAASSTGVGPETGDDDGGAQGCEGACAGPAPMQLMRRNQVIGVVRQAFGAAADDVPFNLVPADASSGLFPANYLPADATRVETYHAFAERAAAELVQAIGCSDEACVEDETRRVLPILFKREALEDDVQIYLGMMTRPQDYDGDSWTTNDGFTQVLSLALQSPQLLYRIEVGEETDDPRVRRLTGHEMATRLALALWTQSPSAELRVLAEQGALDTEEGVAEVVRDMLADPRADSLAIDFFDSYLGIDHFGEHGRYLEGAAVAEDYPGLPEVAADMRVETEAFVTHVMRNGGSMRELFAADYSFASEALATYYGLPTGQAHEDGLYRVELSSAPGRAGVLSHGAVVGAHTTIEPYRAAHRGTFLAKNVLCIELPPPPADIVIPDLPVGLPPREAFEQMTDSETCAGCHSIINPLGFLFENLDAGGRYAEIYPGFETPVDASGQLPTGEEVEGVAELGAALAENEQAQRCLARRLFEYALERTPTDRDDAYIDTAYARLVESDLDLREVIVSVLSSDAARLRVLPEE